MDFPDTKMVTLFSIFCLFSICVIIYFDKQHELFVSLLYLNHKIGTTLGTRTHEKVGEKFLKNLGFPDNVTSFVRGHVDAKRYLVYRLDAIMKLNLYFS